jgi:cytochrome c-type biogenesis protein CcmF
MVDLGQFALLLASSLSSYAIIAGILGAWRKDEGLLKSGRNATISVFACLTVAMIALWTLLIKSDFSVLYVAEHTARNLPLAYKISALWAGSAGSLLLWLWIQVGFVVWVYCTGSDGRSTFASHARGIANLVSVFFLIIMIKDRNPFAPAETLVVDGFGLNPLLQHPAMVLHPPLLFIGYAGFVIPFAWAFAWLRYRGSGPIPLLK